MNIFHLRRPSPPPRSLLCTGLTLGRRRARLRSTANAEIFLRAVPQGGSLPLGCRRKEGMIRADAVIAGAASRMVMEDGHVPCVNLYPGVDRRPGAVDFSGSPYQQRSARLYPGGVA